YVFEAATLEYLGHIISRLYVDINPKKWQPFVNGLCLSLSGECLGRPEVTAFEALKQQLSTALVLGLPDFKQTFVVEMDAVEEGISMVLLQSNRPICYFSHD
nr:retrotransposon-related protein [Tanacetum cinerariifolium]